MSRDIVRRDLHYRRRTAESPAQLARALLDLELLNGVLTLGEAHELSGRLVTSPECRALNVIVFADHLYLLDAPRRHYQHLNAALRYAKPDYRAGGVSAASGPVAGAVFPFAPYRFLLTPLRRRLIGAANNRSKR